MVQESISRLTTLACLVLLSLAVTTARAGKRPPAAAVPPTLEIEVLDPGVDPLGNPAVLLQDRTDGQWQVDIPPVVLVHRYYYSGDRSFQGPMLPGGPSILVLNHPVTGVRCYVEAQMMPGAPRVTYTRHGVQYDYGEHALTVHFGSKGPPTLKYRSGLPWHRKLGKAVHAEKWHAGAEKVADHTAHLAQRSKTTAKGATAELGDVARMVTLPVRNLLEILPFGKVVFSSDLEDRWTLRAAEHEREKGMRRTMREAELRELTLPTVR